MVFSMNDEHMLEALMGEGYGGALGVPASAGGSLGTYRPTPQAAPAAPPTGAAMPSQAARTLASYDAINRMLRPDDPDDPLFMRRNDPSRSTYLALLNGALDFASRSGETKWLAPGSTLSTPLSNFAKAGQTAMTSYEGLENQRDARQIQSLALAAKMKEGNEWVAVKGRDGKTYAMNKKDGTIRDTGIQGEPEGLSDMAKLVNDWANEKDPDKKALLAANITQKNNDKAPEISQLMDQYKASKDPVEKAKLMARIDALGTKTPAAQVTLNQENAQLIKFHEQLQGNAKAAVDTLNTSNRLREILANVRTGPGSSFVNNVAGVLQYFGGDEAVASLNKWVRTNDPNDAQKLESEVSNLLLSSVGNQGGFSKLTENERKVLVKSIVDVAKGNKANLSILENMEKKARGDIDELDSFTSSVGADLKYARPMFENLKKRVPAATQGPPSGEPPGPVLAPTVDAARGAVESVQKEPRVLTRVKPEEMSRLPPSLLMTAPAEELADNLQYITEDQLKEMAKTPEGMRKLKAAYELIKAKLK